LNRVAEIRDIVANASGLSSRDLLYGRRTRRIAEARGIAMTLAREATRLSLSSIARAFEVDHHTTVMRAVRTVRERAGRDVDFAQSLDDLRTQLPHRSWRKRFDDELSAARAVGDFLLSLGREGRARSAP